MGAFFRLAVNGLQVIYQKSQLERQSLKSELALLRSQINPHFLFNTLNNMHSFVHTDPDKTAFSIIKLSEIMRYMLNESNSEKVLLEQEIEYIKSYIALQNMRFSDKQYVNLEIIGDPDGIEIAPMIFIPFIENAFKHGEKKQTTPSIDIKLEFDKKRIYFEVKNIIRKIKSDDIEGNTGFGLDNLKRRLELAYPDMCSLTITKENNQYITKLNIDLSHDN
jgi:LytS/YehU family sensor histidine kinase